MPKKATGGSSSTAKKPKQLGLRTRLLKDLRQKRKKAISDHKKVIKALDKDIRSLAGRKRKA